MTKGGYGWNNKELQMIKKPKYHEGYNLVGISFSERWNIVQEATKEEIGRFLDLYNRRKETLSTGKWNWENRRKCIPYQAEMINLRKTWRLRYGTKFHKEQLYRFDRNIASYDIKLSPKMGPGCFSIWSIRDQLPQGYMPVQRNTILHYSHADELGNHYFYNLEYIDSPYLITFKRDDKHLASIIPLE